MQGTRHLPRCIRGRCLREPSNDTPKEAKLHGRQCPFSSRRSLVQFLRPSPLTPPKYSNWHLSHKTANRHIWAMCCVLYQNVLADSKGTSPIGKSFWTWSGGCLLPPWHIFAVRAFLHNPGQPLPKEWIENLVFLFVTIQDSPLNQRPQSPLCRGRGR